LKKQTPHTKFSLLIKLYDMHLLSRFRKETSAFTCPNCEKVLPVFTHPATKQNAFFLCDVCAFFRPLPALDYIIMSEERGNSEIANALKINKQLDKIKRASMPAATYNKYRFAAMKERQRHARSAQK